jgi:hypothetical protein
MKIAEARAVTAAVANWAITRADIRAMAMAGSWARGNPRPTSDLDLLLLSDLAPDYHRRTTWLSEIAFQNAGFRIRSIESAIYGVVWSLHAHLWPAAEVELTFAKCSWASTDPVDSGTQVVVRDALQIVFDHDGSLARLVASVRS